MLTILNEDGAGLRGGSSWLTEYFLDFKRRAINLLGYQFRTFEPALALSLITNKSVNITPERKLFSLNSKLEFQANAAPVSD